MTESGKTKLHSLLFRGEGELVNVKFFPGNAPGSVDNLSEAAADMLSAAKKAWRDGVASKPPVTGLQKVQLLG
jgi:hypothetical protein